MPTPGVLSAASVAVASVYGTGYVSSKSGHTLTDRDDMGNGPPADGMKWDLQSEQWVNGDGTFPGQQTDNAALNQFNADVASGTATAVALAKFNLAELQADYQDALARIDGEIAGDESRGAPFLDDLPPGNAYTAQYLSGLETKAQYKTRRINEWLAQEKANGQDVSKLNLAGPTTIIAPAVYDARSVNEIERVLTPIDAGVRSDIGPTAINFPSARATPTQVATVPVQAAATIDDGRVVGSASGADPAATPPTPAAGGMAPYIALLIVVIIGAIALRAGRN